ncbi:hypothetical protein D3C71_2151500 [compost metagenome]
MEMAYLLQQALKGQTVSLFSLHLMGTIGLQEQALFSRLKELYLQFASAMDYLLP